MLLAYLGRIRELRNGQKLHVRGSERVGIRHDLSEGERGVGGTEVDTDYIFRFSVFLTQFRFPRVRSRWHPVSPAAPADRPWSRAIPCDGAYRRPEAVPEHCRRTSPGWRRCRELWRRRLR